MVGPSILWKSGALPSLRLMVVVDGGSHRFLMECHLEDQMGRKKYSLVKSSLKIRHISFPPVTTPLHSSELSCITESWDALLKGCGVQKQQCSDSSSTVTAPRKQRLRDVLIISQIHPTGCLRVKKYLDACELSLAHYLIFLSLK